MNQKISVSVYLQTEKKQKKNGKRAIMFCIYNPVTKEKKYYGTKFDLNKDEFADLYPTTPGLDPSGDKDLRMKIEAERVRALNIINAMGDFSFAEFEKNWNETKNGITPKAKDVYSVYQTTIDDLKEKKRIGTASSYECSLKAIKNYHKRDILNFDEITVKWLTEFAEDLTETKERSKATLGIYLRALRAVYNTAIELKIINLNMYPFGKKKYEIPAPKRVKKAIDKDLLKILFNSTPQIVHQQKAKDFFFFSYSCNGMNFKDVLNLKYGDIVGDMISFERAKTAKTTAEPQKIIVYLNDFSNRIIEKYGNKNKAKNQYIFDVIDHTATATEQRRQLQNFTKYVNQHLKILAKNNGIDKISAIWARHSFATNAITSGASMEFAMEALGHTDMKTTKNYIAGFGDPKKREISNKLMEF
jgi:integrase/recombinase XerD